MLYYIHGYQSSPEGSKGALLKQKLDAIPIKYRDCPPEELIISDCINEIKKTVKKDKNPQFIGSSLGGFLAAQTSLEISVQKLILLNPAIIPLDFDIKKITDMPQRIVKDMIEPRFFSERINAEITLIIGTHDAVVPNRWGIEFAKAQEAKIQFLHDDHRLSHNLEQLPSMITKMIQYESNSNSY